MVVSIHPEMNPPTIDNYVDQTMREEIDQYCDTDGCKVKGLAVTRFSKIAYPPRILMLQLERFGYSNYGAQKKHFSRVLLRRDLDLTKHFKDPTKVEKKLNYELYSIISHEGRTTNSGHYTNSTKIEGSRLGWVKYNDDAEPQDTNLKEIHSNKRSTPYLLFYRRKDIEVKDSTELKEEME